MKKSFMIITFVATMAHAGFWGSLAGGAIGGAAGSSYGSRGGGGGQHTIVKATRMDKVNTYLWKMHKIGKYSKDYTFFLKYLEQSDDINDLDTVAWVYKDNGNKQKAIEIYKQRILPWLKIESPKIQNKFKRHFQEISDKVIKIKKRRGKMTEKQMCLDKGGKWIWSSNQNKWICYQ